MVRVKPPLINVAFISDHCDITPDTMLGIHHTTILYTPDALLSMTLGSAVSVSHLDSIGAGTGTLSQQDQVLADRCA